MKRWFYNVHIAIIVLVAAAFVFAAPGVQLAFGEDQPKIEKIGKSSSAAETKMMNKTNKTPKAKAMGNGADKAKVKTGAKAKGDDVSLKKGGKAAGSEK